MRIPKQQLILPFVDRSLCPDGRPVPDGMTWCGRCGEIIFSYSLVINHDLGYCGCPVEFDPTFSQMTPRKGFRYCHVLTRRELNNRWDKAFFPDCKCGDAFGNHDRGTCRACFRCREYRPK